MQKIKELIGVFVMGGLLLGLMGSPARALAHDQPQAPMIFTSNRDGSTEIYSAQRNGDNMRRLTNNTIEEQSVAASPDGSKVAFVTTDESRVESEISILDIQTGVITPILATPDLQYQAPAWSPDGKYIAYSFTASQPEFTSCIAVFRIATHDTNKISCSDKALIAPSWSPDGQRLIFTQFVVATGGDLYTVNVFSGEEKHYLRSGFLGVFSPSGDKIAYSAWDSEYTNQIYVANADGSAPRQITTGSDLHTVADWATDDYITYTNVTPNSWRFEVKSTRSDGSGTLTIPQKTPGVADWPGKGLLSN